jgi:hypothetical protein
MAAAASRAAGQGVLSLTGCNGAAVVPGMPCGTWLLNQALSSPTSSNFGYFDPLGQPCTAASRGGAAYAGCPPRSASALDIVNALPGFPVYSMTENVNGVKYTLYAWTVGFPGAYEAVIGFAPGTAPTYANHLGVLMNLYASPIANTAQAPYVTFAQAWVKNPSNPNAVAYTLTWAAMSPPPASLPPPPLPPAPPPDAPDPVIVTQVQKNAWAVWTSITLFAVVGTFVLLCTVYFCVKNAKMEREENAIERGESIAKEDVEVDSDDKSEQGKMAARAQRKSRRVMYSPPPPPSAFIVVQ